MDFEYKADPKFSEKRCRNLVKKIDLDKSGTIREKSSLFSSPLSPVEWTTSFDEDIQKYMDTAKSLQKKYRQSFQHDQ